jgi:hypothetical protein
MFHLKVHMANKACMPFNNNSNNNNNSSSSIFTRSSSRTPERSRRWPMRSSQVYR